MKTCSTFDTNSVNETIAFCKREFEQAISGKTGSSIREQLENVWRQTGKKPKELEDLVELPSSMIEVWSWFITLHESRSSNGFGVNPISFMDIWTFFQLQEITPYRWEIDLIKRLDREVMSIFNKKAAADSKAANNKK